MKFLFTTLAFLFLLSPAFSFAATYPASCPAEARAIVDVVGGCSAINESEYGPIYEKCCSAETVPKSIDTETEVIDTKTKSTSLTPFFIKPDVANVRECAGSNCKVLGQLKQNTILWLPYDYLSEIPNWVEYEFADFVGYMSKTVLSDKKSAPSDSSFNFGQFVEEPPETPPKTPPETPPEPPPFSSVLPWLIVWMGVLFFATREFWEKGIAIKLKAATSKDERRRAILEIGFWRFVSIVGILFFGNGIAVPFEALAFFAGDLYLTNAIAIYVVSLVGGFFFGSIMWLFVKFALMFQRSKK